MAEEKSQVLLEEALWLISVQSKVSISYIMKQARRAKISQRLNNAIIFRPIGTTPKNTNYLLEETEILDGTRAVFGPRLGTLKVADVVLEALIRAAICSR